MAGKVLNIEVGDRLTKVCLSTPKGKSYHIRSSFMFQTPDNAVADGNIAEPEALAAALKAQLLTHGLSEAKGVIFAVTSSKVATREVVMPLVKDSRLKGLVESNAGDYFPVDLSKYHVTYSLLERVDRGENQGCRVMVLAAPLSLLEGYFKLAELAGLKVQAVDFSGNSQYQALCALGGEGVTLYVNLDCNSANLIFLKNGNLLLQRAFSFGGDEMVLSYMQAAGKGPGEYVAALTECSTADPKFLDEGPMSSYDVSDSLARIVSSVVRTMDFYNSSHWDKQAERVVLMGPCSHLAGLQDMIAEATGLDTAYLDDLPGVASFANAAESASFFISCIGSSIAPLDFMPPQFKESRKKGKKGKEKSDSLVGGVVICLVCVLAALAMGFVSISDYRMALDDKSSLEREIASLEYTRGVYETYLTYQASAEALTVLGRGIDSPNDRLSAFIGEMEAKLPAEIILLSAVCSRESVSMNVTVPGYEEAAVTIVQLRSFESLADVQVSALTRTRDESGGDYVSFAISCAYGSARTSGEVE